MKQQFEYLERISKNKRQLEGKAHEVVEGLVSICIPNYNNAEFLKECLNNVFEQSYAPIEIICVDDHSEDSSFEVLMNAKAKATVRNIPLKILRLPKRCGTAWAQNMAYYLASGEYLANWDSDDLCHPERIEKQLAFLKSNKFVDMVGTNYEMFSKFSPQTVEGLGNKWLECDFSAIRNEYLRGVHSVCFGSLLLKRSVVEHIGGLSKSYIGTEDFDFVRQAILNDFNVANIPEVLYYYREHKTQRSKLFHQN